MRALLTRPLVLEAALQFAGHETAAWNRDANRDRTKIKLAVHTQEGAETVPVGEAAAQYGR
jgi:hypothetical protein